MRLVVRSVLRGCKSSSVPPEASLQTRTTLGSAFPRSERLRAPMGPISGGIGSLGDGVPEGIAGDKKKFTPAVITAKFLKKNVFCYSWHAERGSNFQRLGR